MSAVTQGSEEGRVVEKSRNGSDSARTEKNDNSEKPVVSPPVSTGSRTKDNFLGGSDNDSTSHTMKMEINYDNECFVDPDLRTEKELVIEDTKPEVGEDKSEMKVPEPLVKESKEGSEASKPPATPIVIVDKPVTNDKPSR